MARKRRTEQLSVDFKDGVAKGWVFGVADAFRVNLDIRFDSRIDAQASKAKEQRLGRKLQPHEKVVRRAWTQGVPAAYSLGRGHLFHDPPIAHQIVWEAALPLLRRSIVVLEAKADAGALVEVHVEEDTAESSVIVQEADNEEKAVVGAGWVDIEVLYYEDGRVVDKQQTTRTQQALVEMLRTGRDPLNSEFDGCRCGESSAMFSCLRCSRTYRAEPETLSLFDGLDAQLTQS
jgi:hypothetical protein